MQTLLYPAGLKPVNIIFIVGRHNGSNIYIFIVKKNNNFVHSKKKLFVSLDLYRTLLRVLQICEVRVTSTYRSVSKPVFLILSSVTLVHIFFKGAADNLPQVIRNNKRCHFNNKLIQKFFESHAWFLSYAHWHRKSTAGERLLAPTLVYAILLYPVLVKYAQTEIPNWI